MLFAPQHFAAPDTTAHEWLLRLVSVPPEPATETSVTPEDKPDTDTGVDEEVVEPFPSWPLSLAPQHFTAPATTAHACADPTEIDVTPELSPTTDTGVKDESVVPLPSWPLEFSPQHFAAPLSITHVLVVPAEIELWARPLSPVDPVSLASASAMLLGSPNMANMPTTTKSRVLCL